MAGTNKKGELPGMALVGAGLILVTGTLAGYGLGFLVDKWTHMTPIWAIVGLILGTALGFYDLLLLLRQVTKATELNRAAKSLDVDEKDCDNLHEDKD
ncbi:MAG: AtpZ/AtpI family protein [bacterium]